MRRLFRIRKSKARRDHVLEAPAELDVAGEELVLGNRLRCVQGKELG